MPRKSKPPGDYEVGYGKPPQHTRFKPGQSGNPRGRTKGSQDLRTVVADALKREFVRKVTVIEGGKARTATKFEVIVTTNVNKAVKGDARALREIVTLAHRFGLLKDAPDTLGVIAEAQPFSDEDQAIVDRFLARERARAVDRVEEAA